MTIINRFLSNIEKYELVDINDTIILAASGGPDSQFLLDLFYQIQDKYQLNIILVHLNHLHRKEASEDENLVIEMGKKYDLEVRVKRASMDDYAKINKISSEDAGRRLRYDFFNQVASEYPNSKIAVAHNMDDQAETMLFRMARGTGLDGLAGMDYKNKNIIRPILSFKKSEILAYLDKNNISYAIDRTNLENDYTRNYIRNKIFPQISTINPNAIANFFKLSDLVKEDLELIKNFIDEIYEDTIVSQNYENIKFDRQKFENLSYSVQARLLRKAIYQLNGDLKDFSKENIDKFLTLLKLANGKKIIKDDIVFIKNYRNYDLEIYSKKEKTDELLSIDIGQVIEFAGLTIRTSVVSFKEEKSKNIGYFDLDKLDLPLKIRTRRNGDKFIPLGMKNNKKIKDFFIDEKVDRNIRDTIPLIISADKIIWLVGYRISEEFKVSSSTRNILKIEVSND